MKLVVGLGNPGEKYARTRHNVGFIIVDAIANYVNLTWSFEKKFDAYIAKTDDFILTKPITFMNSSGNSVSAISSFFKISPEDIYVIHDDVDLPSEEVRVKQGSGSAGHHGVESIIEEIGTKGFYRIRIGVGRPQDNKFDVENYVLQNLSDNEYTDITNSLYIGMIIKLYLKFISIS